MYTNQKPFFIRVVTPLHAGTGSDIGIIDMPIQRERHTNFPKIESSGLKGSLREYFEATCPDRKKEIELVFGPEKGDAHAAAFSLTDAAVLFFPVKSARGVYVLLTCPTVLSRYNDFCGLFGEKPFTNLDAVKKLSDSDCRVANKDKVSFNGSEIVLEEYAFNIIGTITMNEKFKFVDADRIVCVSDNVFRDFVTLSTELITRNKVDSETGTVKNGALFSEEFLPPETILYSFLQTGPVNKAEKEGLPLKTQEDVERFLKNNFPKVFQIGGDATIGKGIVKIEWNE